MDYERSPVLVSSLSNVAEGIAGDYHTMVRTTGGDVYTFGWNASGQIGDGTTNNHFVPYQVSGLSNVTKIAAGRTFSLALESSNDISGWGSSDYSTLSSSPAVLGNVGAILICKLATIILWF